MLSSSRSSSSAPMSVHVTSGTVAKPAHKIMRVSMECLGHASIVKSTRLVYHASKGVLRGVTFALGRGLHHLDGLEEVLHTDGQGLQLLLRQGTPSQAVPGLGALR